MKKLLSLILAAILTCTLGACGSGGSDGSQEKTGEDNSKPIKLTFMAWDSGTGQGTEIVRREIVENFNKEHEGEIEIVPEYIPSEQTKTKLPTLMAANDAPDIFMAWASGYMKPYVDAGKVYSLQEVLDEDEEWKNQFLGGIMEHVTFNDEIYAIPTVLSTQVAYYNKEIYDKFNLPIPETHEEFIEGLKVIRDSGEDIIPMAFGNSTAWPSASHSEILANRIGGDDPFKKAADGSGKWTDESFVKAAGLLQEIADEKLVPEGFSAITPEEAVEQFKSGKAASFIWSSYCISNFQADDSAVKDKVVLAKCPTVENGAGNINTWLGQPDECLVISEKCENKEAAVEFLKYYTQISYMQEMANNGTLTTINADYLDLSTVGSISAQIMDLQSDMESLFLFYDVALGSVIGNEYNNTVQGIMSGNDPQEAFENFQKFFDENYEG